MKKIYKIFLLAVFLLLFFYSTFEIIAFILLSIRRDPAIQAVPDYAGGISYKANKLIKLIGYEGSLYTDNYGFVHNGKIDRKIKKDDIFIFGGSTLEGIGSSTNSKTIPALIEKCLFSRNINNQVINIGHAGDYSVQQKSRLFHRVLVDFDPSLVIFFDGRNDAHYSSSFRYLPFSANQSLWGQSTKTEFKDVQPKLFNNLSILHRRVIRKLNLNDKKSLNKKSYNDNLDINKNTYMAVSEYHKIGDQVNNQLSSLDIKFMRILQPTLIQSKKVKTNDEKQYINRFLSFKNKSYSTEKYSDIIKSFYRKVKKIKRNYFYDLSDIFEERDDTLYSDSVHYNDKSNKIIADKVCKIISEKNLLMKKN